MDTAFQREVHRERLGSYERQAQAATGRVIVRRELRPAGPGEIRPGGPAPGPSRVPFEDRRTKSMEGLMPKERPRDLTPSRIETSPRERMPESRPKVEERRPETTPRERMPESRPSRGEERRPEAAPKPEAKPHQAAPKPEVPKEKPKEERH